MTTLPITEAIIRQHSSPESFRRGQEYERQGAVIALEIQGNALEADVEGSAPEPYEVVIDFDAAGIATASCTCPVELGWCKHIVAALLVALHEPASVEEQSPLASSIGGLNQEQLREILMALADRDPAIARLVEAEIALQTTVVREPAPVSKTAPSPRPVTVDTRSIRRQVQGALHSLDRMRASEAYWHVSGVLAEMREILNQAWTAIRTNDGPTALAILDAITDEYVKDWMHLDGSDGETGEIFSDIGHAWTEAVLSADLSAEEREEWTAKLEEWQDEIGDYGIDDAFGAVIDALELGWDDPDLQAVLAGEPVEEGAWNGWAEPVNGGLTVARLNVLERQGRNEEYLRLAHATGLMFLYAAALVRLGRGQEAAEFGLARFTTTGQAFELAQRLREKMEFTLAVSVAERGLSLDGPKTQLAPWLRDLADNLRKPELALEAAEIAFRADRSLASYLSLKELAGDQWAARREPLLDDLRKVKSYHLRDVAEVFLHEGLVDDAIAAVDGSTDYHAVEPVVKAASASRPDWAIRAAKDQAEPILDRAQADYYHHAVRWLGYARDAYIAADRRNEWQVYVDGLSKQHARKHKLMPMLKGLGR